MPWPDELKKVEDKNYSLLTSYQKRRFSNGRAEDHRYVRTRHKTLSPLLGRQGPGHCRESLYLPKSEKVPEALVIRLRAKADKHDEKVEA